METHYSQSLVRIAFTRHFDTEIDLAGSQGLEGMIVQCTSLPRGVQENLSLLGDDHLEDVPKSSAMLGSTVDTCSCVCPTMNLE